MIKRLFVILSKLIALGFFLYGLIFYLHLGWFIVFILMAGMLAAVWITRPEWKTAEQQEIAIVLIIFIYTITMAGIWKVFIDKKSYQIFTMTWIDKGADNDFKQSEIVLQSVDDPAEHIGIYSTELSNYLHQFNREFVDVTFEVWSDFGCVRGFNEIKIGELTSWKSAWGYASVHGDPGNGGFISGAKEWWCW